MKTLTLVAALFGFSLAYASDYTVAFPKSSAELKAQVQANLKEIEAIAETQLKVKGISFRKDRIDCLGTTSMFQAGKALGTCLIFGDAGWPNSDTIFSVSVGESESSDQPIYKIQVITYEL